jgi:hypothetical protein
MPCSFSLVKKMPELPEIKKARSESGLKSISKET